MDSIAFQIPLKALSLNHSHEIRFRRNGGAPFRGKSNTTAHFERQFHSYLHSYRYQAESFLKLYNPYSHIIAISVTIYTTEDVFFTKPKSKSNPRIEINDKAGDLDNYLKIPIDLIFKFLNLNDKVVKRFYEIKQVPSDMNGMKFKLSLEPFPAFESFEKSYSEQQA